MNLSIDAMALPDRSAGKRGPGLANLLLAAAGLVAIMSSFISHKVAEVARSVPSEPFYSSIADTMESLKILIHSSIFLG